MEREHAPSVRPEADSTLRLYLASVAGEMDGERAVIEGLVLPELRAQAERLGLALELVDPLKTRDDDWDLARRFREIDACRPFFLALLGERYGDPPLVVSLALVAGHPWLAEDPGRSVLELEILHAALRDPATAAGTFFYLRDPRFLSRIPDQHRARFLPEGERAAARLAGLKERIRASGRPVVDGYPCEWSGSLGRASRLDVLAERLIEDLWPAIEVHARARIGVPGATVTDLDIDSPLEDTGTAIAPPLPPMPSAAAPQTSAPALPPIPPRPSCEVPASAPAARPFPSQATTVEGPYGASPSRSSGRGGGFKAVAVLAVAVLGLSLFLLRARTRDTGAEDPLPEPPVPEQPPNTSHQGSSLPPANFETYDLAAWRELTAACELSREDIARLPSREEPGASMIEVFASPSAYNAQVVQRQTASLGAFVLPRRVEGKAVCAVVLNPWEPAVQDYLERLRSGGTEPRIVLFPQVPG